MKKNLVEFFWVAALLLAGCGRANSTPSLAETLPATRAPSATHTPTPNLEPTEIIIQGTVTLWHSWEESEVPILVQVIRDFQLLYPEVHFDVLYIPYENLMPRFETAALEGGGPAILLGPADWGPNLYDQGLLADLSEFASSELLNRLNPAALGTAEYQNVLIGLPYTIQGVVLYRNIAIIPEVPVTFDDLVSLARSSTQGEVLGAFLERSFFFSGAHLNGIGGALMQSTGAPAFNDEKGLAWVELLQAFGEAGPTDYLSDQDLELFRQGKAGFIIDGTWSKEDLAQAIEPENLAIDPWPAFEDGYLSGYVQSDNIYMSARAGGDNHTAAWKFIEFFLSTDTQQRLAETGHIPAIVEVEVADVHLAQMMAALAGGTTYPSIPVMNHYPAAMDVALRSVFEQGVQPSEALQAAMQTILTAMTGDQVTPTP